MDEREKGNNANNDWATRERQRQAGIRNRALTLVILQEGATKLECMHITEMKRDAMVTKRTKGATTKRTHFLLWMVFNSFETIVYMVTKPLIKD
eukprot:scaffold118126_cov56-Attheya_sp.AAC.3